MTKANGRPKKEDPRTFSFSVRTTASERDVIEAVAASQGMAPSQLFRTAALRAAKVFEDTGNFGW